MTKSKFWTAALCLSVTALLGGQRLWAADPETAQWEELKTQMQAEGWTPIAEGVFERHRRPTKVEHMAYGPKGLAWHVGELNRRLERLVKEYENYPSQELGDNIDNLKIKIASLRRELRSLPEGTASLSEAVTGGSCSNICYSATADAYPLTSSQGTGATADAKFNSTCGYVGTAFAHAYARATTAGGTQTVKIVDDPVPGTGVASTAVTRHAEATAPGSLDCYSEAYASVDSTALGIAYSTSEENYGCPTCTASISGTSSTSIRGTNCKTLTWTSTVSCGSPTYAWKIDGAAAGSGTSVSRTYCGNNNSYTQTVNVSLTVTGSGTKTASFTTTINYLPPLDTGCTSGQICQ